MTATYADIEGHSLNDGYPLFVGRLPDRTGEGRHPRTTDGTTRERRGRSDRDPPRPRHLSDAVGRTAIRLVRVI